ncbi:anti-sigma factor [uncultured Roseovarius sp.]|uniref:anti-sigma factor family protein n=1 Tax=uncultured Roseovarius sp. TaxID=293344 RepID=UPI00261D794F|nr:anti-sigma factor [uncultured Roseovarius sp.]
MTDYTEKLSAFLDGELPEDEAHEIEKALASDPELQTELEAIMAADTAAQETFAAMLEEPVPFELAAAIQDAPVASAANEPRPPSALGWISALAVVIALLIGGGTGYFTGLSQNQQIAAAPGWLDDIADYHRVYASQGRHLVEVPADEADHIKTWLTKSVGAEVRIPDLSEHGLTFRGARLLVAAGKPVSQLMYTDTQKRVVALCLIQSDSPREGFDERTIGVFDMVTWGARNANFVIVGDEDRDDLGDIALSAAEQA